MASSKDSPEVVAFMALFTQLKEWSDDDPEGLPEFAKQDESIKDLCKQTWHAAWNLKKKERSRPEIFSFPVDPKFLAAWRDYEERFGGVLGHICVITELLGDWPYKRDKPDQRTRIDSHWDFADSEAEVSAQGIGTAIDFAYDQATDDSRQFSEGIRELIEEGSAAWDNLTKVAGFDLRGIFRRRELIPFVLVPRHVSAKHGDPDKLSMFTNLQQAHEAFIFGAPFAALALMRSIMEAVLRDHYGAQGNNLSGRIKNAQGLPSAANIAALDRLRKLANDVLHLNADKGKRLAKIDPIQLEKEIVLLLLVLRALIEGAPR